MDVSTFYALFSAACFALVGLWWGVVQRDTQWVREPVRRHAVGGVYLAFLLPALMGLFAQVAGTTTPAVWRLSFVLIALIGAVASLRLLSTARAPGVTPIRAGAVGAYAAIATVGVFPQLADQLGLRALQAEALLLAILVALGHALVWRFMVDDALTHEEQDG